MHMYEHKYLMESHRVTPYVKDILPVSSVAIALKSNTSYKLYVPHVSTDALTLTGLFKMRGHFDSKTPLLIRFRGGEPLLNT